MGRKAVVHPSLLMLPGGVLITGPVVPLAFKRGSRAWRQYKGCTGLHCTSGAQGSEPAGVKSSRRFGGFGFWGFGGF